MMARFDYVCVCILQVQKEIANMLWTSTLRRLCATLDYIYHIFDKFAVSMALCRGGIRGLSLYVLLKLRDTVGEDLEQRTCKET